jgi:hypothetical protein
MKIKRKEFDCISEILNQWFSLSFVLSKFDLKHLVISSDPEDSMATPKLHFQIEAFLDPLSMASQRVANFLLMLRDEFQVIFLFLVAFNSFCDK